MNCRGGIKKKILIGLAAFVLIAVVSLIIALPSIVRHRVTAFTGCPVEAATVSLNPFAGTVRLDQFHLRNPAGFTVPEFVDLTLLDVDVAVLSLWSDVLVVPRAIIDLEKVTIVTGKDGVTNSGVVRQRVESQLGKKGSSAQKFRIGELEIRIGTIELVDYSRGTEPVRRTIAINANHRFTDVTDPKVIVRPLLGDFARANAAGMLGEWGGLLPGPFGDAFGGMGGVLKKFIDSVPLGR